MDADLANRLALAFTPTKEREAKMQAQDSTEIKLPAETIETLKAAGEIPGVQFPEEVKPETVDLTVVALKIIRAVYQNPKLRSKLTTGSSAFVETIIRDLGLSFDLTKKQRSYWTKIDKRHNGPSKSGTAVVVSKAIKKGHYRKFQNLILINAQDLFKVCKTNNVGDKMPDASAI